MNSESDYTICNLDSHSYGNAYTNSEIPATIYGYNTNINNSRSIDTGQHYYGTENIIHHGLSGVDLSTGNGQALSYPVNSSVIPRQPRHHQGYDLAESQGHLMDPYLTGHGLALNSDAHLGGGASVSLSPGRTACGGGCIDTLGSCSLPNSYGAVVPQQAPSPIKCEAATGQSLQSKPFRWMQIKRNPAKSGKKYYFLSIKYS